MKRNPTPTHRKYFTYVLCLKWPAVVVKSLLDVRNSKAVQLETGAPDSREIMKPIRSVGSLGRSSTHCEKDRFGAYTIGGGVAAAEAE